MHRIRRSALTATAFLAAALPGAAGLETAPAHGATGRLPGQQCETASRIDGHFRSVPKPAALPGPLVAHAVEPADPATVYLADPLNVVVSRDAGCTWAPVLTVPASPGSAIRSLSVPDSDVPTGRLLVVVATESLAGDAFAATSTVWSRTSAGGAFRQSSPLPGVVTPAIAPGDPDTVYLATTEETSISLAPARSTDGGATFTVGRGLRTYPTADGPSLDSAPRTASVNPLSAREVLVGSASLQRSTDGGDSWETALDASDVGYTHALAAHPPGANGTGHVVLVGTSQSNTGLDDPSARLWTVPPAGAPTALPAGAPLVGVPQSLSLGRTTAEVVLTTAGLPPQISDGYDGPGTLLLLDAVRGVWMDVADGRGHPLLDSVVDRSADPSVHLHSSSLSEPPGADEYVVYSPPAQGAVVPPSVDDGTGTGTEPPSAGFPPPPAACPDNQPFDAPTTRASEARLTPDDATVAPDAEGKATHTAVLDLPGDVSALDLHLLLDVSDSMGPAAAGVVCGLEELVTGLADDGVDVRIGLSTFYDDGPGERYRREVDLAPPGRDLQRALRTVQPRGGEETHRTALLQTVTGTGLTVDGTEVVAPGQGASFREEALKVVLHVTDEPWTATTPGEPSPFAVVDAFRAADVRHVGIQVVSEDPVAAAGGDRGAGTVDGPLLRTQLDQFSAGSGALAPAAGVDCDGDGDVDLREDDPLVCVGVSRGGVVPLSAAVRALVDALDVRGTVALDAVAPAGVKVGVPVRYDDAPLRERGRYEFPVDLTCLGPAAGSGRTAVVALTASAASVPVAQASVRISCGTDGVPVPGAGPGALPEANGGPLAEVEPGSPSAAGITPPPPPPPTVPLPAAAPGAAAAAAPSVSAAGAGAGAVAGAGAGAGAASASGAASSAAAPAHFVALEPGRQPRGAVAAQIDSGELQAVSPALVSLVGGTAATLAATALLVTGRLPGGPGPQRAPAYQRADSLRRPRHPRYPRHPEDHL